MKWLIRLLAVSVISTAFAFLLSQIPEIRTMAGQSAGTADFSVFGYEKEITLTDHNVVDVFEKLPLRLKIDKIDLGQKTLSVDLLLLNPDLEPDEVFPDLIELASFSFEKTGNIEQLFVRVMQAAPDPKHAGKLRRYLLVAVDARKRDYDRNGLKTDKLTPADMEHYVRSRFHLVETARWNDMRGPLHGSYGNKS